MRLLKYLLPLLALLIWSATVSADYDPTSPPEPGVNFTLTTRSIPEKAAAYITPTTTHSAESSVRMETSGNHGFQFVQWEDENGNVVSTERIFTYSMPAQDATLIAHFEYDPSDPEEPGTPEFKEHAKIYFGIFPTDAGYIYANGSYYYNQDMQSLEVGTTHYFGASEARDYNFINWTLDGEIISDQREFDFIVPSGEHTLVANFEYNPSNPEEPGDPRFLRTLTVKCNPEGAGNVYGSDQIYNGETKNVFTTANQYYTFVNWTDDLDEVVSEERDFYYTMPNRNVTLTANFTYNYDPANPEEPTDPIPPGSIAENMVAYPRFGMFDDTHVMILCETEGSTIHYTLDGSEPNAESPVYTEPVYVPNNLLVRAIAYKEGMDDSPIISYQVTTYHAIAPIFTFVNRKIEITSDTEDAVIRYTLDFSEPTAESTVYTEPVQPEENCRIKAYASKEGLTDSKVSVFVYRRADYTVDAPTFSLNEEGQLVITPAVEGADTYYTYTPDGEEPTAESIHYDGPITLDGNGIIKAYTSHINYFDSPVGEYVVEGFVVERPAIDFTNPLLTLSTATANAQIRYTLDGTVPSESAEIYSEPIRLTEDCHVVARGFKTNYEPSDTISLRYVYNDYKLPTPTASFANKVLTLTCEDSQAQIRYTTDDSEPTAASSLYDGPISLTEDCTVKFIAIRENFNNSDVNSFVFVYTTYRVATPAFNYDTVNKTISISCETEDAEIRYTTDGSDPTATTGTVYTGPIDVNGNATFTARAFRSDFFDSAAATLSINDQSVPTPTASFANLLLTISCEDPEAQIYYTTDGSTPSVESTLYEGPVALTEDCTVKFIATHENFNNSPEGSYEFVRSYFAVATPTFTYDRANQAVTITTTTEGAEIRYTTDGTLPEANTGTVYTGPVAVNGNANFIARAFKENMFPSETASLVIDDQKVPDPTASFGNRVLTLSCPDSGAEIRYTTDGTEPTAQSALYEAPLSLAEDCTVRFIAMHENYNNSEVASFIYVRTAYMVATPTFSYNSQNHSVTMASATENAEIRYTLDGSVPTATTGILYEGPITIVGNLTINAVAFRSDLFDSELATLSITDQTVPTPTATFANKTLTLTCEDPEAEIRYTVDGTAPTAQSTLYTGPIALANDCLVNFIAIRANFNNSAPGSFALVTADHSVATPAFNYDRDKQTVTIACDSVGAVIRYTTDGTVPTATTGTLYTEPLPVNGNVTYTARAFRDDLYDSQVATLVIDDQRVPAPVASFGNRVLTLSCPDANARIYYTTDGTMPSAQSTPYQTPIALTQDCTVRFIAIRENFLDSDDKSFEFVRADYTVATPVINYQSSNHTITITCDTPNAEIRYTTDGTEPTATTGIVYTGAITVECNGSFNAKAFRNDLFDSAAAGLYRVTDMTVPTPTASFANKHLTLSCEDTTAEIRYTMDGSTPNTQSTLYEEPIAISEDCTVRFIAIRENFNNSAVAPYTVICANYSVATPKFNFDRDKGYVTIACDTVNAEIRYTIDGSEPTAINGIVYTEPIPVSGNVTFRACAFREDLYDSQVAILVIDEFKVKQPVINFENRVLTITCPTENAEIHYTIDGTTPTVDSPVYTGPVALTEDCTVRVFAVRENYHDSDEATPFTFTHTAYMVAAPAFSYNNETRMLTISCGTADAVIRYTTDGTVPTATTGNVYTEAVEIVGNRTINAKAFRSDLFDSEVATLRVTDQSVPVPTARYANRSIILACSDNQAQIRYTLDHSTPTAQSTLYENPIPMTGDCTVKFMATRENFNNSAVDSIVFKVAEHQVATPKFEYNDSTRRLTITCDTVQAEIRYTIDNSVPTATTGNVYTEPVEIVGNRTINARAFRSDLFDSETATHRVTDQDVPKPEARYANRTVILSCPEDPQAQIYYTLDGTAPTAQSTLYENPIPVSRDCTVRFIAVREYFNNSPERSYIFRVADHQVATPKFEYNNSTRRLTITCDTVQAEIRYTIDGSVPTATTGNVYTEPVEIVGNRTINAVAFRSDLFDSEVATYSETDQDVPKPEARYANRTVILSCPEDPQAQIYYTLDGTAPTAQSTLYENPIPVSRDCTVRFIAVRENFNNSPERSYTFRLADYQEDQANVEPDFRNRKITISHPDNLSFDVTLNDETTSYQEAVTLDVTPDMGSVSVVTPAATDSTYNSDPVVIDLKFHSKPSITSNGHIATIEAEDNVEYVVSYGGKIYSDDSIDLTGFGTITAYVESDNAFRSDEVELAINSFNTGSEAGVQKDHRLGEVFETWGDSPEDYVELQVLGELNREDLEFISTLPNLTTLLLSPTQLADESYDSVLAETNLEIVTTNQAPEGILKGMPRLTTVVWEGENGAMPNGRLTEAGNPNILLWVANKDNAPEDAANVVVEGKAESITLYAGHPFNAHKEITVTKIDFIKTFSQSTAVDTCRGWETIAIPFTATSISHERAGEIQPFKNLQDSDEELKPFWLYQASETGWEEAGTIEAGVPYIISMPNSPDYIEAYNLNGTVTFSAENVTLGTEGSMPKSVSWIAETQFEATFMPIEGNDISSLNCREIPGSDEVQGSKFLPEADTLPFECFMRTSDSTRRRIPVFGDWAGLQLPTLSNYGVIVEPLGGGKIRISSERDVNVDVFTPTGMRVRSVNLNAGESEIIDSLAKGIYIIAGKKISIN